MVYPQLDLKAQDIHEAARICRLVSGMPLALVLAAGWLEVLSFKEIAGEITCSLDILQSQLQDLPERQRSVRAVFEYSWKRLSEADQRAFMRLSVFPNCFTRHAAQQVAKASLHTLRNLMNKSLISMRQDSCYEIHEMLHQFGEQQLEASGEAARIRNAHREYSLNILTRNTLNLKGRHQLAALQEIEAEFDNIRAAWYWAVKQKDETAIGLALESLYLYCDILGRQREGVEYFESARRYLKPDSAAEASLVYGCVLTHLGMLQSRYLRNSPQVAAVIEDGLEILQKYDHKGELAFGFLSLGHYAIDTMNDVEMALPYIEQSLKHFEETGDDFYAANALYLIGHCHAYLSGLDDFIRYTTRSLKLSRSAGDWGNTALTLVSLSLAEFFLGDYISAESYAQEAADIATEIGNGMSLAQVKTFLGLLHLLRGNMEQAGSYIEAGFSIAKALDFPIPMVYAQASLAALASLQGLYTESLQHVQASKAYPGSPYTAGLVAWASALALCGIGDFAAARQELREVFALDRRFGSSVIAVLALPVVALILAQQDRPEQAVETLSLAYHHPLSVNGWMEHWPALEDLRADLDARLDLNTHLAAWERGKNLHITQVIESFNYAAIPISP
jgi:tetratricopeptide (TPR) repeat protein